MSSNEKPPQSPLAVAGPWDRVAGGYVTETVPFLEGYARRAMGLVEIAPSARVLDVAAGPGTLSFLLAPRVKEVVAVDFAPSMIEHLRKIGVRDRVTNVESFVMDGQALSLPDASFDAAFSMFGLMFFPDRPRGFAEMFRVLKPGGTAVVSSWAPIDRSPSVQAIFAAIGAAVPETGASPRPSAGLDDAETFMREMRAAGFEDVAIHSVVNELSFTIAAELWASFERGNIAVSLARQAVPPSEWNDRAADARARIETWFAGKPKVVRSEAYVAVGRRGAT